jgi:hypothetical protein
MQLFGKSYGGELQRAEFNARAATGSRGQANDNRSTLN